MSLLSRPCLRLLPLFALAASLAPAESWAVVCTMQAQMTDAARGDLSQAAKRLAVTVQSGNVAAARALTIPEVAAHFDPIASSIRQLAPEIASATITVDSLYGLDASDLKTPQQTQFFCASSNAALHVEVSISQLPPGKYALALVHATGVPHPQQMAFLLMNSGASWQLAGFFARPLLMAGHDSVWYWTRAREFAQKGQKWNAYFFLTTAAYLSSPVDFLSSPNSEKLAQERAAVTPPNLPGAQPLTMKVNGQTYLITDLHTDGSLGGLDLVVHYEATDTSDPVATRARNLALMKAMLTQYPELRDGFHGLWVFADAPSQRPFGIEQPMSGLP